MRITSEMLKSSMLHGGVALLFQAALTLATGNPWYGVAASLFFLGREHMGQQAKIKSETGISVKDMKPTDGFNILKWGADANLDWIVPVTFTTFFATVISQMF